MEYSVQQYDDPRVRVQISTFHGESGVREVHLFIRPLEDGGFADQLKHAHRAYHAALKSQHLAADTALFRRFFCNDLESHAALLAEHPFASGKHPDVPCAVSWVRQPPTPPARLAIWAYHVSDPRRSLEKRLEHGTLTWTRNGLSHCWTTGAACPTADSSYDQTRAAFEQYHSFLESRGLSLAQNVIRTWLFVRDIDTNYQGVVAARREFFSRHGLTPATHFIASTGIEGGAADPRAAITLDALAIAGVQPAQVAYLAAPDHLCPTYAYGVTFERGVAVSYRDRTHVIISGTASIDVQGNVIHRGDVSRQLDRAIENVNALLHRAGAALQDMAVLVAYVRDPRHRARVEAQLRERFGPLPFEVVSAAICRPEWLVEIEGIALTPASRPELPGF